MEKELKKALDAMEKVIIGKEDVLNVTSWDWKSLKNNPDSIDWIPALRALEKLEKIANKQLFGVNYDNGI